MATGKSVTVRQGHRTGWFADHRLCDDPCTSAHGGSRRAAAGHHSRVADRGDNSPVAAVVDDSPVVVVAVLAGSPVEGRAGSTAAAVVVVAGDRNQADHSSQNCRRRSERPEQVMSHQQPQCLRAWPQRAWRPRASCQQSSAQCQPGPFDKMAFRASSKNPQDADQMCGWNRRFARRFPAILRISNDPRRNIANINCAPDSCQYFSLFQ